MSLKQTVALAVVGLLLTTSVAGANAVVASERTVLDPGYVEESLAESGFYEQIHDEMLSSMTEGAGADAESLPGDVDTQRIAEEAVSTDYVRSQVDANIERTYAFLHGNREEPNLWVDLRPVKRNVSEAIAAEVRDATLGELLESADVELSTENVTVNSTLMERLTANESSYRAAREDFRDRIRERVIEAAVDEAFAESSNEELLLLVMDESELARTTEEERERLVDEHEAEIRTELRTQIEAERGDEIDETVDAELASLSDRAREEAKTTASDSDRPENVTAAATELQITVVDGLTGEQSYDAFKSDFDAAKTSLAGAIGAAVEARLDENLPDRHSFTQDMPAEQRDQLDQAASMVQLLDTLAVVLPLVALGLIGLIYVLTRSVAKTASTTGSTFLVVGVPAFLVAFLARDRLPELLSGAGIEPGADRMSDVVLSLADGVFDTIAAQSLLLSVVGLALVGLSVAHARGLLDDLRSNAATEQ